MTSLNDFYFDVAVHTRIADSQNVLHALNEKTFVRDASLSPFALKSSPANKSASYLTRPFALFLLKELREWNGSIQN